MNIFSYLRSQNPVVDRYWGWIEHPHSPSVILSSRDTGAQSCWATVLSDRLPLLWQQSRPSEALPLDLALLADSAWAVSIELTGLDQPGADLSLWISRSDSRDAGGLINLSPEWVGASQWQISLWRVGVGGVNSLSLYADQGSGQWLIQHCQPGGAVTGQDQGWVIDSPGAEDLAAFGLGSLAPGRDRMTLSRDSQAQYLTLSHPLNTEDKLAL